MQSYRDDFFAWEQCKLGDVCEPITDSIDTQKYPNEVFAEYSMPAFDASMKPDIVLGSSMNSVRKIITRPCLLVNKLNVRKKRIWYVKKPNKNAVCSAEFIPLHSDTVDLTFLNQVAKSETFTRYLENHSSGSSNSQKRITPRSLMLSKLHIPTIEEQKLIGKIFESLDRTITLHEEKKHQLERLKSALLQKMFADKSGYPAVRFEGFSDEWEQCKLSSMTQYKNGKGHEDKQTDSGDFELVNLNSISIDGGFKHSGKFVNESDDEILYKNDLVMILSDVGHGDLLGRVALIPDDNKFILNQRVALLRPNKTVNPEFLFFYINSHQKYFKSQGAGMSQLNISKKSVETFSSLVPNIDEQKKISLFLMKLDSLITLHDQKLSLLKRVKQTLLQKMFI